MATRKQKEALVEALKFVPGTYTIRCSGYGGEIVLGTVEREAYNYFIENDVSLDEYATAWHEEECGVPDEHRPFPPGEWYNCDDVCHGYGVEMSDLCQIEVEDPSGNIVWQHCLEPWMLEEAEIGIECREEYYAEFQRPKEVVFLGQSIEKGVFFSGLVELTGPFDPKKLKFIFDDIEGVQLLSSIEYRGEAVYNDNSDTVSKSLEFKFLNTD